MLPAPCPLLVAAFAPELAPFSPAPDGSVLVDDARVATLALGVGMVRAAASLAAALALRRPSVVVFCGTCGAYPGAATTIGQVVVARRVALADMASIEGRAAMPSPLAASFVAAHASRAPFARAGAREADVGTTLAITTDDALATRLAAAGPFDVEHLEAFAVAVACEAAGVPWAVVLGVANEVGSRGRAEWASHHAQASAAAARVVTAAWHDVDWR